MRRKGAEPTSGARGSPPVGLRQRLYELLEHGAAAGGASRLINGAIIALIVVNLIAAVLESVPELQQRYGSLFTAIEVISLGVFTLEYGLRLWLAGAHDHSGGSNAWHARWMYATSFNGIVDLIAIAPFWVALFVPWDLRAILVFRVFRLLKLARYSLGVRSLLDALYEERRALAGCVVIFAGATLLAASLMYLAEREVQPDKLGTIPLALWWAVTTLGTTGYGDVVPVTVIGRVIASLTIMSALVMVALPVGLVASAFAQQIHRRDFMVTWGMVARVPLFEGLTAAEIADISRLLSSQNFDAGETIVHRGDPAESMFFVCSGEVEVDLDGERKRLGPGHFFGEVAVLRRARRSGTVIAATRCQLLALDAGDLRTLMQRDQRIAQRMREVTRERLGREILTKDGDLVAEELDERA
jgi:voltage-gated potassium channel